MSTQYFSVTEHIVPGQHIREFADCLRESQEDTIRLHVKQYTPLQKADNKFPLVTVIGAHGNGFPKEASEPLWDEILLRSQKAGFGIRDIWIADVAHQGHSYVLNESILSDDVAWFDHSRDLLHIVNHFRGKMQRPLIGIGHSLGSAQLLYLASLHPRLFNGLVLIDPVIQPKIESPDQFNPSNNLAYLSTYRRDIWPNRKEASVSMRRAPVYASWDDRAWDAYVKHGLRDLPTQLYPELPAGASAADPPVTLTTPPNMEVHTFVRPNFEGRDPSGQLVVNRKTHPDLVVTPNGPVPYPFYRSEGLAAWNKLPELRPSVLFVLGEKSFTMVRETKNAHKLAGTGMGGSGGETEGRSKRIVLDGVGHGIPFEVPAAAADACAPWIGELSREWAVDEETWKKRQRSRPVRDHVAPTDEWKKHTGPPPVRQQKKAQPKI